MGGEFAAVALEAGAWGVVVEPERALARWRVQGPTAARARRTAGCWRRPIRLPGSRPLLCAWAGAELGCRVVGITGSVGKTSVKDTADAILPLRVHASPENYNTEIGLPLAVLGAPPETQALVLEMAMRGRGQIAQLCGIAEPDVAAITNIGPVHLELLGTLEAIAEAKAEILAQLGERDRAVVPADTEALEPHLHDRLVTITFGAGGDVFVLRWSGDGRSIEATVGTPTGEQRFVFPFGEGHNLTNALAAIAIGEALELPLEEMARRAPEIALSRLRGELVELADGIVVVNDCYNANPISMRAALDHLVSLQVPRPARGGARRDGGAGPERARLSPRGGGPGPPVRGRADRGSGRARPRLRSRRLGPRYRGGGATGRGDARAGRCAAGQGFAVGRPRARHRRADRPASNMTIAALVNAVAPSAIDRGQLRIAGMAAMLITIFLGPKFIEFLRAREFGQQIREEGPAELATVPDAAPETVDALGACLDEHFTTPIPAPAWRRVVAARLRRTVSCTCSITSTRHGR